jgi:hypothetical protein
VPDGVRGRPGGPECLVAWLDGTTGPACGWTAFCWKNGRVKQTAVRCPAGGYQYTRGGGLKSVQRAGRTRRLFRLSASRAIWPVAADVPLTIRPRPAGRS